MKSILQIAVASVLLASAAPASAQTVALLRGAVVDVQGGTLPGATVRLSKSITGLERTATTSTEGHFQITNIPLDTYDLRIEFPGFAQSVRQIDLRTSVPVELNVVLELAAQTTSVTVVPDAPLVDTASAGTRNQVSMTQIEQMP